MNDLISCHFEAQAKACEALGSPFTARVCRAAASILGSSTEAGRCILDWPGDPGADAVSLRLCGGLHALVLSGADEELAGIYPPNGADENRFRRILAAALQKHDATLMRSIASPPQTNEIARSGMLLPGFLFIARKYGLPLALREIGASAGLNLDLDRFHYRYGPLEWGNADSPVRLSPEVRGNPPPLGGMPAIASREGCDIAPVDLADPAKRLGLRSFIWADQAERLGRLAAAIQVTMQFPVRVVAADAAAFVKKSLAERMPRQAFVLFHSIMWQYLPQATKSAIGNSMLAAGGEATESSPIVWLRMEPLAPKVRHATLSLTSWPGGETRHLADCDYHGRWIEWTGGQP